MWALEGTAHYFFVSTTNDVISSDHALLLCFQQYFAYALKHYFFKFKQRHVFQYGLILLEIKNDILAQFSK